MSETHKNRCQTHVLKNIYTLNALHFTHGRDDESGLNLEELQILMSSVALTHLRYKHMHTWQIKLAFETLHTKLINLVFDTQDTQATEQIKFVFQDTAHLMCCNTPNYKQPLNPETTARGLPSQLWTSSRLGLNQDNSRVASDQPGTIRCQANLALSLNHHG